MTHEGLLKGGVEKSASVGKKGLLGPPAALGVGVPLGVASNAGDWRPLGPIVSPGEKPDPSALRRLLSGGSTADGKTVVPPIRSSGITGQTHSIFDPLHA